MVDIMKMDHIQVSYVMYVCKDISNALSKKYIFPKNITC